MRLVSDFFIGVVISGMMMASIFLYDHMVLMLAAIVLLVAVFVAVLFVSTKRIERRPRVLRAKRLLDRRRWMEFRRRIVRSSAWVLAGFLLLIVAGAVLRTVVVPSLTIWFPGPYWESMSLILPGFIGPLTIVAAVTLWMGARFGDALHCPGCGHDLTGVPRPPRCPECGIWPNASKLPAGRLVRRRAAAVGVVVCALLFIYAVSGIDNRQMSARFASAAPTSVLLDGYTSEPRMLSFSSSASQELEARLATDPEARAMALARLASGMESEHPPPGLEKLISWAFDAVWNNALSDDEIERIAPAVWRAKRRGDQEMAAFWQVIEREAPEIAARIAAEPPAE